MALAITSLGGSNVSKEMMLAQQQASNKWAYYQAKVIREHQYRTSKLRFEFDLAERGTAMSVATRQKADALLDTLGEAEKRYHEEKQPIEVEAKVLEAARDLNMAKDPYFDYAEVLQILIVIASISMLAVSRPIFAFSVVLAGLGVLLAINGYLLLVNVPHLGS